MESIKLISGVGMNKTLALILYLILIFSCSKPTDKEAVKRQIFNTEKSFEKMCAEKGIAEAFYFFADDRAVIKRQNDSLIIGNEKIKLYYSKPAYQNALVNWAPDFVDVSDDGTLAYSYGKYLWEIWSEKGDTTEYRGVFHTVWKKQRDGNWKYVWD